MRIEVTAAHISNGHPGKALHCPIALAIKVAFPYAARVVVGMDIVQIDGVRYGMPGEAAMWAVKFDMDGHSAVEPFAFDLPETPAPPARRV